VALHFHGVEKRIEDPRIQISQHDRDDFYALAKSLKANFQVLPLDALPDVLKAPARHRRSVFLMSDDGYRNALTETADILDGLGLPWTLFVATHHVGTGDLIPQTTARLFFLYAPPGHYPIPHLGVVALDDEDARAKSLRRGLKKLRTLKFAQAREALDAMQEQLTPSLYKALLQRFASERFLNWSEVGVLAKRGVAIGAHANWHWPMDKRRTPDELAREAEMSRRLVEHQIGPCRTFAYPFGNKGDVSREAWQAVRDAGYAYGFTTLAGSLDGGANPWLLPRYGLGSAEPRLDALLPMLRAGNSRLARWQRRLA
jgi:peptidoglycan/xylan/chitin deacetylase (PgdA/CDA1 family)